MAVGQVLVPRFGIESQIRLDEAHPDLVYSDELMTLTAGGHTYRMFDWLQLEISIDSSKPHRPALKLDIISNANDQEVEVPPTKKSKKSQK